MHVQMHKSYYKNVGDLANSSKNKIKLTNITYKIIVFINIILKIINIIYKMLKMNIRASVRVKLCYTVKIIVVF